MANQFDIYFTTLQTIEQQNTFKFFTFGEGSSIGVKGFPQLVNKWIKCFLTSRGSDPTNRNYGTQFPSLIGSNVSLSDAQDISGLAVQQCNTVIFNIQAADLTLTPSERLSSAKITRFIPQPEVPGFQLYVEIKNQAQEQLQFTLPTIAVS